MQVTDTRTYARHCSGGGGHGALWLTGNRLRGRNVVVSLNAWYYDERLAEPLVIAGGGEALAEQGTARGAGAGADMR